MDTTAIMDSFKADNLGFVDDVIKDFKSGKGALHLGASIVVFHAIRYGDVRPITRFVQAIGHETNEGKKFKVWVGNVTKVMDGDTAMPTLGFNSKEVAFSIKPGTHNLRGTLFVEGVDKLVSDSAHFLDFKKPTVHKQKALNDILKTLRTALKSAEAKAEENGVVLPNDIKNQIDAARAKLAMFIEA